MDGKFSDYDKVFTPGSPIQDKHFLIGREQEIIDIRRSTIRRGLHPIVIGNRGVGKTSVVNLSLKDHDVPFIKITCNSRMQWDTFARSLLTLLNIEADTLEYTREEKYKIDGQIKPFKVGVGSEYSHKDITKKQGLVPRIIEPWLLFKYIKELNKKTIIVIDEYDAISSRREDFHQGIADLIKTLSDNSGECDSRIVVVGIARSAEDLLGKHESIERSAREIFIRPLRREDVFDFLTEAEEYLKFSFDPIVKKHIVWSSMGYPYFVHLVGLECLDVMVKKNPQTRYVEYDHYIEAIRNSVKKAFRSELRKYKDTMASLAPDELELLRHVAFLIGLGKVPRIELQKTMAKESSMSEDRFNTIIVKLEKEKRIIYVSRNRDDVRIIDPLMAPFLRGYMFNPPVGSPKEEVSKQLQLFSSEEG